MGRGRVYNIKGLRVVDIAFTPVPPSGNPWVAVAQIGAVIARFILDDWGSTYRFINIMPLEPEHPCYVHRAPVNELNLSTTYPSWNYGSSEYLERMNSLLPSLTFQQDL